MNRPTSKLRLSPDAVIAATAVATDHVAAVARRSEPRPSKGRRTVEPPPAPARPPARVGLPCHRCTKPTAAVKLLDGILTTSNTVGQYCHRCLPAAVQETDR